MAGLHKRTVAVAVIAVLNAAWFLSVGCAALCSLASCPQQQLPRDPYDEGCHHKQSLPDPQRGGDDQKPSCPGHPLLTATAAVQATSNFMPRPQAGGSQWLAATPWGSLWVGQPVSLPAAPSHSPPGSLSSRTICQKESILRI